MQSREEIIEESKVLESKFSKSIRVLAAVEKIWIKEGLSVDGALSFDKFQYYASNNEISNIQLEDEMSKEIYENIDYNRSMSIDKEEMTIFFEALIKINPRDPNLEILKSKIYKEIIRKSQDNAVKYIMTQKLKKLNKKYTSS